MTEGPDNTGRSDLVSVITSPLGFFALSLLIVEGFLGIVLIFSGLDADDKFLGMIIGAGLFFLVVFGVWLLVLLRPTNLTFGEKSHLEQQKMSKNMYGTNTKKLTKKELAREKTVARRSDIIKNILP